jgi:molecular chaperone GrpE
MSDVTDEALGEEKGNPKQADEPKAEGQKGSTPPSGEKAAAEAGPAEAAGDATPPSEAPQDPLEVAKAEAQKYRDQLLRTAADFDNFRKRSRREAEDAQRRGKENFLKEFLPVFDNLERAATSADVAPDIKSVAEGIRMVLRQFGSTLDRVGIKRVETVGKAFDPALHEAIQHIESDEHEPGLIAAEVQPGYLLGESLVRAALVVVSKGPGPNKADAPAEAAAAEASDDPPSDLN